MKNYKITVNGNMYDVTVEECPTQATSTPIASSISTSPVNQVTSPVAPALKTATPPTSTTTPVKPVATSATLGVQGTVKVNSPMPGKILNINVSVGQSVKKGEALVVLEAMKMENEIVAPVDGTVASVNVSVGISVEPGELLASLN